MSDALTTERWSLIPGFGGLYEASDLGNIRSLPRTVRVRGNGTRVMGGNTLTPFVRKDGRRNVLLSVYGHATPKLVAHLVLEAFVGPRPPGLMACHRNDIPSDDRLTNLRWDTQGNNLLDRTANGNDPHRARKTCPRGHKLEAPNLVASRAAIGHRCCLACARGRSYLKDHPEADFAATAHRYYNVLMGVRS